jgi:hypothetical protein
MTALLKPLLPSDAKTEKSWDSYEDGSDGKRVTGNAYSR